MHLSFFLKGHPKDPEHSRHRDDEEDQKVKSSFNAEPLGRQLSVATVLTDFGGAGGGGVFPGTEIFD